MSARPSATSAAAPAGTPVVSVLLPTRNRADVLPRAIRSVLAQTFGGFELIVVDDASDDGTPGVVAGLASADPRIRPLRLAVRAGAAAARNRGVAEARGEYLALLDDDDEWLPRKLERQLALVRGSGRDIGIVHSPFLEVGPSGRARLRNTVPVPAEGGRAALLRANLIGHSTVLVRRRVLQEAGGYDERLPRLQDWDLWIRIAGMASFGFVPTPLARIHATPASISTRPDALREASRILLSKVAAEGRDEEVAALRLALGRICLRSGCVDEGRRLVVPIATRRPWRMERLVVGLLALLGGRAYGGVSRVVSAVDDRRAERLARRWAAEVDE